MLLQRGCMCVVLVWWLLHALCCQREAVLMGTARAGAQLVGAC